MCLLSLNCLDMWSVWSRNFSAHNHSKNPPNPCAPCCRLIYYIISHLSLLTVRSGMSSLRVRGVICPCLSCIPLWLFSNEINLRRNLIFFIRRFASCLFSLTDSLFLALVLLLIHLLPGGLKQATVHSTLAKHTESAVQ